MRWCCASRNPACPQLRELLHRGEENGVEGLEILSGERLRAMEPAVSEDVVAALWAPTSAIVCPFGLTIALAENAAANGIEFRFDTRVDAIRREGDHFVLSTTGGEMETRTVISAAGVYGDVLHNQLCPDDPRTIVPRKGEYCLLDRRDGALVGRTIFQLPGKLGKGVLVSPTVHGNLLIGPTATDQEDRDGTDTTQAGLDYAVSTAERSVPHLPMRDVITSFAGLRAHLTGGDDFVIGESCGGFFEALGIESPGLSSAPAIGAYLARAAAEKLGLAEKADFNPRRARDPAPEGAALCRAAGARGTEPGLRQHHLPLRGNLRGRNCGGHPPRAGRAVARRRQAARARRDGTLSGRLLRAARDGNSLA